MVVAIAQAPRGIAATAARPSLTSPPHHQRRHQGGSPVRLTARLLTVLRPCGRRTPRGTPVSDPVMFGFAKGTDESRTPLDPEPGVGGAKVHRLQRSAAALRAPPTSRVSPMHAGPTTTQPRPLATPVNSRFRRSSASQRSNNSLSKASSIPTCTSTPHRPLADVSLSRPHRHDKIAPARHRSSRPPRRTAVSLRRARTRAPWLCRPRPRPPPRPAPCRGRRAGVRAPRPREGKLTIVIAHTSGEHLDELNARAQAIRHQHGELGPESLPVTGRPYQLHGGARRRPDGPGGRARRRPWPDGRQAAVLPVERDDAPL